MHLLLVFLLLAAKLPSLVWAAPSPNSKSLKHPRLSLEATTTDTSLFNLTAQPFLDLLLGLNTTGDVKVFHVPHTYITLLYNFHSDEAIQYKLLRNLMDDAIDKVNSNLDTFGNIALPANQDPYVDGKFAGKAPAGVFLKFQSPREGPAYGRKLTWGDVKATLVGLRAIMVTGGKPYKLTVEIRNDNVGLIGTGEVTPGEPPRWTGLSGGLDVQD